MNSRKSRATPAEAAAGSQRGAAVALLLCATALLAPALGVPHEEMLQDTLKSIVVAFGALCAGLLYVVQERGRRAPVRWHDVLWLPIALAAWALGSMAWSHAYLAGVEAVRWSIFVLLAWLALQTLERERLPWLAWALHGGAVVASLWAALQFWADWRGFPQGPSPASTFVNRNFFAEYAVCTVPFAFFLIARQRRLAPALALSASAGFVVVALLMTGTRSALIALGLLLLALPLIAWRCRAQLAWPAWPARWRLAVPAMMAATVLALGAIPSGNPDVLKEGRGATALERGLQRAQSIGPSDTSLGVRMVMWRATLRLIADRPLAGVGAGAWEHAIPLYQDDGSQLETDYYVHNEYLQLVAEYGLPGVVVLALLFGYLAVAAWHTWRAPGAEESAERAVLLASLLALLVVSSIGFPWRLAATGALFALVLGALAASDARLGAANARALGWSPAMARAAALAAFAGLVLAAVVTHRAAESERRIVQALKLAMAITASGQPQHPGWRESRAELLRLVREGIALNPHYRKITPLVADELAGWGHWSEAIWIWESVLSSRPHVVAILGNVARGYTSLGQPEKAHEVLERARRIQPDAPAVRSLEVILLAGAGEEARAMALAREALAAGRYDHDLVNMLQTLARRAGDWPLAVAMLQRRMQEWPQTRALGQVELGLVHLHGHGDRARALEAFRAGLALGGPRERGHLLSLIPPELRGELDHEERRPGS